MKLLAVILPAVAAWALTLQPTLAQTNLSGKTLGQQILAAYGAGQPGFTLPAGTYTLTDPHDSSQYVNLAGMTRAFTVDFSGSTFLLSESTHGFLSLTGAQNLTVKNATIRYPTPPFTQGTIVAVTNNGLTYEVALDSGYPAFNDPVHFATKGMSLARLFDGSTRLLKKGTGDLVCMGTWTLDAATGHYFFTWAQATPNAAPGDLLAVRGLGGHAIFLSRCGATTLSGITIYSSPAFCVYDFYASAQNFYTNITVDRDPEPPSGATALPLFSSCADGIHSLNARQGPALTDCHLAFMQDDGIAVHGRYSVLTDYDAATGAVTISDGALAQADDLQPGDTLRFYDLKGSPAGEATIASVTKLSGYTPTQNSTRVRYTSWAKHTFFRIALTAVTSFTPAFDDAVCSPQRSGPGYNIRNCTVRNNRENGITVKGDNGTITGCTFDGDSACGIVLTPEIPGLGSNNESDFSHDVTISGCTVHGTGYEKNRVPAICIQGPGTIPGHHRITLTNNTVSNVDGWNLWISQADAVTVTGNIFDSPCMGGPPNQPLVRIGDTTNVTLSGNQITHPGAQLNTKKIVSTFGKNTPADFAAGFTIQP